MFGGAFGVGRGEAAPTVGGLGAAMVALLLASMEALRLCHSL